jgi:hypothetical protein
MTAYEIKLRGCDEVTTFVMDLTGPEARVLQRCARRSRETSAYSCEPTMTVTPSTDQEVTQ